MEFLDTSGEVLRVFADGIFRRELWRDYAAGISAALPDKLEADAAGYDFQAEVLPRLRDALGRRDDIRRLGGVFQSVTAGLCARCRALFSEDLALRVILCLGLCNGAGWATKLDGADAVLLGIEKILELGWGGEDDMTGLIYHEIGHVWHARMRQPEPQGGALWQLYAEGVAMHCEQRLCGKRFYHQDRDGWLAWCDANRGALIAAFKARLAAGEGTQDFFGDWRRYQGRADVGYYIGAEFIGSLSRKYDLRQIAALPMAEVREAFGSFR